MVEIKAAVANATTFAKELLDSERAVDLRLEEIDSSVVEGNEVWLVTLSNPPKGTDKIRTLSAAFGNDSAREYRVFAVRKSSGEILSMKIRLFANPN